MGEVSLLSSMNMVQYGLWAAKKVFLLIIPAVINPKNNRLEPSGSGLSRNILTGNDNDRWCYPPECETIEWLTGLKGCNKNNTDRYGGYYCSALIMQDGWQITSDYPW